MLLTASAAVASSRIRNISVFSRFALNALWFCSFPVAFFVSRFVVVESQVERPWTVLKNSCCNDPEITNVKKGAGKDGQ